MGLSQSQKSMIEKARSGGGSEQGISLNDEICVYLVAVIARDLDILDQFGELPRDVPDFFESSENSQQSISKIAFLPLIERLFEINPDADTYFACLANLHKRRLKYERILETQAFPTIDQVGPRCLLQFGTMSAESLAALLFWRKWFFDIDNRAGQETGYLFEPIIAHAIGGSPFSAKKSPVRRTADSSKGRQVDCIRDKFAYEFKIRVTIASSGQGRWQEELDFPVDCQESGYLPILIVLDPTPNPKLDQLEKVFLQQQGEVFKGEKAWAHLDDAAGRTMALFLEKYVRYPLQSLLAETPQPLPDFSAAVRDGNVILSIGNEPLNINRSSATFPDDIPSLPEDADDQIPGP
jgi:hypothetical protein